MILLVNTVYQKIFINIELKGPFPIPKRCFNVRLGSTISDNFEQEIGVPL